MNIAYSCNDYYIPQTGISIISVCENHKDVEDLTFYFIAKDVAADNIQTLREICGKYDRAIIVIPFEDIAFDLNISSVGRHIETIYSKVFFSRIENVDKMIYLDSDTVVVGSLKELWNEDLEGFYMGVVETNPTKLSKELGLPKGDRFFNDGMAIVNVDYCRKNDLIRQVIQVVEEFHGDPPTLSEGALNKVCYNKVKYISLRYNLMAGLLFMRNLNADYLASVLHYSKEEIEYSCDNPIVIHYLSAFYNRPWLIPCTHPYKDEYFKYQALSPWKDTEPKYQPLPKRIIMIKKCYELFGPRLTNAFRKVIGATN